MIYGKVNQKRMEKVKKLNLKWYALIHHYDQEKLDPYNVLYDDSYKSTNLYRNVMELIQEYEECEQKQK